MLSSQHSQIPSSSRVCIPLGVIFTCDGGAISVPKQNGSQGVCSLYGSNRGSWIHLGYGISLAIPEIPGKLALITTYKYGMDSPT